MKLYVNGTYLGRIESELLNHSNDTVHVSLADQTARVCLSYPHKNVEEPTEPGWYTYSGGTHTMIFHLRKEDWGPWTNAPQWSCHLENGDSHDCEWSYIEQGLGVWDLVKLT